MGAGVLHYNHSEYNNLSLVTKQVTQYKKWLLSGRIIGTILIVGSER